MGKCGKGPSGTNITVGQRAKSLPARKECSVETQAVPEQSEVQRRVFVKKRVAGSDGSGSGDGGGFRAHRVDDGPEGTTASRCDFKSFSETKGMTKREM